MALAGLRHLDLLFPVRRRFRGVWENCRLATVERQWLGVIRFAAVHSRALNLTQIQQNFAAGVGERYFLLFNVSSLTGMAQSYVMFEVSRYDSYSYLFNKPVFLSLDASATPGRSWS